MAIKSSTVDVFLEEVGHIVRCMRNGDSLADIQAHVDHGRLYGQLITIHPEFLHASQNNGHSVDPSTAINTLLDTLLCIATAQQQAGQSAQSVVFKTG